MNLYQKRYFDTVFAHERKEISDETCEIQLAVMMNDLEEEYGDEMMRFAHSFGFISAQNKYDLYDPFNS